MFPYKTFFLKKTNLKNHKIFLLLTNFLLFTCLLVAGAYGDVIIDNGSTGTSYTGTWYSLSGSKSYGINSLYTRYTSTYTWKFPSQPAGVYEVYMWWSESASRATKVSVAINHRDGKQTLTVNQSQNAGQWNSLGQYNFNSNSGSVVITAAYSSFTTCADAVWFRYVSPSNMPPLAVIDSISPSTAPKGATVTFSGHGTDSDGTITGYNWRSSINGNFNTTLLSQGLQTTYFSIDTASLSQGLHTIYLKVIDDKGLWSSEVKKTLTITAPLAATEHIYVCLLHFTSDSETKVLTALYKVGARQDISDPTHNTWKYSNSNLNKTFIIHIVKNIESMKQALYTEGAHIVIKGHANYGMGAVFMPNYSQEQQTLSSIRYIDDDLILNYSSPWISAQISDVIYHHQWSNWQPIFKDGTSGIMPYNVGDPRGNPPYNYYITYQVPGDPKYYKIESVRNSAPERFTRSRRPAWYSENGDKPDPTNNPEYFFIVADPTPSEDLCGSVPCPAPHYGRKTIFFRKDLEIDPDKFRYKRMFYDACNVGNYYMDTFHRGIMFYSVSDSETTGSPLYLQLYLQGKSDREIWEGIQAYEPSYDYYDFNKRPSEQQ